MGPDHRVLHFFSNKVQNERDAVNASYMDCPRRHAQNVRMLQFGKNLRRRARELGLTDAEAARRAGLTERRYGFYVTGEREPDLTTLLRIAEVLQTSVDGLLTAPDSEAGLDNNREAPLISAAKSLDDAYLQLLVQTAQAFSEHQRSRRPLQSSKPTRSTKEGKQGSANSPTQLKPKREPSRKSRVPELPD